MECIFLFIFVNDLTNNKKMKGNIMRNVILLFTGVILILSSCSSGSDPKLIEDNEQKAHIVIAEEVIQVSKYTYVKVNEGEKSYWIAVNKMEAKEGETYFFTDAMLMKDFESKDLGRTFDSIYFVQSINTKPGMQEKPVNMEDVQGRRPNLDQKDVEVEIAEGGIRIAELFANRAQYSDKIVKIRGEVVKVNPDIMGINWVHIQDGTNNNDNYDLTVTTHDKVQVGDIVTFEGKITLDKDFGAGYFYDVIMENARQPDIQY